MQHRNLKYVGINLSLAARSKTAQVPKELTKGKCIRITFFAFGDLPPQNINLSIEDTQGNPILEAVDVRDYKKGNTGGLDAYKHVNFNTNGKVLINLFSPMDAATAVNGQILFVIDTDGYA